MISLASLYIIIALVLGRIHEMFAFLTPLRPVMLVGAVCAISTVLASPTTRQPPLAQREVKLVLAMAALAIILVPFSAWPSGSIRFLVDSYGTLVLLVLIIALAVTPVIIRSMVLAALIGEGLLGLFTLASVVTTHEHMRAYASSTFDPNDVAMMMVLALPFAVLGTAALRGVHRLLAAGVAVICVLATVATVSRGGLIGLATVTILIVFRLRSVVARLLAGVVIVLLLTVAAPAGYWNRMDTIWRTSGTGYDERGVSTRVEVWQRGLSLFLRSPVTGVGIGAFEAATGAAYGRNGGWRAAHNSFIQVATELGIFGFVLFVWMLVASVRNARQAQRAANKDPALHDLQWIAAAVEISLYAYVVTGFSLSMAYAAILSFLVGVAAALRLEVERQQRAPGRTPATQGEAVGDGREPWWRPRPAGIA